MKIFPYGKDILTAGKTARVKSPNRTKFLSLVRRFYPTEGAYMTDINKTVLVGRLTKDI